MDWTTEDSKALYNIHGWGEDYFFVSENGNLSVTPSRSQPGPRIEISRVVDEMRSLGVSLPTVIRFHDILRSRIHHINKVFKEVIEEAGYSGNYFGVYPIKVNQLREVVEEIMDAGGAYSHGLEAGSKAELLATLAIEQNTSSLTILNGYKDDDYLRLALLGTQMGRNIITVIERPSELTQLIKLSKEEGVKPIIGIRAKLTSCGSGRWKKSCGERAKFGLSIPEIMEAFETLKKEDMLDSLKLFHFHIGSQIPDIKSIKGAITEGAHIYAGLQKMGADIEYFDVGGGVAVDYEGTKTRRDSSRNYGLSDYAADVVYVLKQICEIQKVPCPNIVSETGRAVVAQHSCIIVDVFGEISQKKEGHVEVGEAGNILLQNMKELKESLSEDNFQDVYNDSVMKKEEAHNSFKLGYLSLEEMAKVELLYSHICHRVMLLANLDCELQVVPEEISSLKQKLAPQYLCNFSVFQSLPDSWAIGQLMPIVPLTRLNERPTRACTLADITCDSDGKIDSFIGPNGPKPTIQLHELKKNEPYHLGIFLTGAYQDIMGDMHNLFGRLNEVHVFCDDDDPKDFYIEEVIAGNKSQDILSTLQYSPVAMAQSVKKSLDRQVQKGTLRPRTGVKLTDFYEKCLTEYTYLKNTTAGDQ
ncbi:MAG: biosynthetic arginine decarboxylase [Bacteriovoracaceae bacterium]|jgi:arginine decarboxylase|nr:biosynthetic arginine decarboxylase [Bacteriovoracaceae bacterium]